MYTIWTTYNYSALYSVRRSSLEIFLFKNHDLGYRQKSLIFLLNNFNIIKIIFILILFVIIVYAIFLSSNLKHYTKLHLYELQM